MPRLVSALVRTVISGGRVVILTDLAQHALPAQGAVAGVGPHALPSIQALLQAAGWEATQDLNLELHQVQDVRKDHGHLTKGPLSFKKKTYVGSTAFFFLTIWNHFCVSKNKWETEGGETFTEHREDQRRTRCGGSQMPRDRPQAPDE